MTAIYKRELKSFFHGFVGWLFIAATLFMMGIYFTVFNQNDPKIGHIINFAVMCRLRGNSCFKCLFLLKHFFLYSLSCLS